MTWRHWCRPGAWGMLADKHARPRRTMTDTPVAHRSWTRGAVQERLRRLNLITTLPPVALVGVLLVVLTARSWASGAIQVVGLAAALVTAERWTAGDFFRVARPCLAITAATWLAGALINSTAGAFALCIVGAYVIPPLPRHRL